MYIFAFLRALKQHYWSGSKPTYGVISCLYIRKVAWIKIVHLPRYSLELAHFIFIFSQTYQKRLLERHFGYTSAKVQKNWIGFNVADNPPLQRHYQNIYYCNEITIFFEKLLRESKCYVVTICIISMLMKYRTFEVKTLMAHHTEKE